MFGLEKEQKHGGSGEKEEEEENTAMDDDQQSSCEYVGVCVYQRIHKNVKKSDENDITEPKTKKLNANTMTMTMRR